jgi:hypothetical protein
LSQGNAAFRVYPFNVDLNPAALNDAMDAKKSSLGSRWLEGRATKGPVPGSNSEINALETNQSTPKNSASAQAGSRPSRCLNRHLNKNSNLAIGMDSAEDPVRSETSVIETTIKAPQSDQWSTRVPACNQ